MIDPKVLGLLRSSQGQQALAAAQAEKPTEKDFLPLFQSLARQFPELLSRAAVEQAILRQRARPKFHAADRMYFDRESLEQATGEEVARNRSNRFRDSSRIFDLGCGIGGDTFALAEAAPVMGVDIDRSRLRLLRVNAEVLNLSHRIDLIHADILHPAWRFPPKASVFLDPDRRVSGLRVHHIKEYRPPLPHVIDKFAHVKALAIKVSPAVDWNQISGLGCEVEFISVYGQLKEATLWFRTLKTAERRATLLPGPFTLAGESEPALSMKPPGKFLLEPDPAILRAGLVRTLGRQLGANLIDPTIAYLTSNTLPDTPFIRAFRIEVVLPFGLNRLRRELRDRDVGKVTIIKRGSAVDIPSFERRLRLRGRENATVILTRVDGKHKALLVEPVHSHERLSSRTPGVIID
jgi:SAM-dependent methyltransferase